MKNGTQHLIGGSVKQAWIVQDKNNPENTLCGLNDSTFAIDCPRLFTSEAEANEALANAGDEVQGQVVAVNAAISQRHIDPLTGAEL